jgi:hypothetical protein
MWGDTLGHPPEGGGTTWCRHRILFSQNVAMHYKSPCGRITEILLSHHKKSVTSLQKLCYCSDCFEAQKIETSWGIQQTRGIKCRPLNTESNQIKSEIGIGIGI